MSKKYQKVFKFKKTEDEAKAFCECMNREATSYMRKHHPAHYTPWTSQDGKEHYFCCWFYF